MLRLSRGSAYRFIANYVSPLLLAVFAASLFTTGLISFEMFSLSTTSWDLAIILLAVNAAALVFLGDRSLPRLPSQVIILAAIFGVWVLIAALRSPQEFRGITMAVLLLRNYVMSYSLIVILNNGVPLARFNRIIFITGVVMAAVAVLLFVPNADAATERRPFGSIIILFDEFQIPRLTGLINDPNFYAVTALIALFAGLSYRIARANVGVLLGIVVIMASLVLSFSRGGYAAFAAGLGVLVLLAVVQRRGSLGRNLILKSVILASAFTVTFSLLAPVTLIGDRSVWDLTRRRFETIEDSPRLTLWRTLVEEPEPDSVSVDTPSSGSGAFRRIFGNGLRSNEVRLNSYSHSSYLDVSEEMGIGGVVIWGAIAVIVAIVLFRAARADFEVVPWLAAYAVVLLMMGTLSMLFMPYFWLIAAMAVYVYRFGGTQPTPTLPRGETPRAALPAE